MTNHGNSFKDLTGMIFGKLTVIEENGRSYGGGVVWKCICSCDNKTIVNIRSSYLIQGETFGCNDCMKKHKAELIGFSHKKYNEYDLSGDYGIGYFENKKEFWFDKEDFSLISKYYWNIDVPGYPYAYIEPHKQRRLHQIINNLNNNFVTDHINKNKLDNRKENFRICSNIDNVKNANLSKNNTSGVTGVSWCKKNNIWRSDITVNRKAINLGRFNKFEDAVKIRLKAEKEYFGEFAPQQHLYEKYGII